ncbi:hypothetical protein XENOCAPTIV_023255 [Xenoophorus captivus]|uniref:Uncharacterized protein n=1 Tax=Xenoophorus captivus TaxID=1517983 RepID=A0ABV0QKP1_9TELE
MVSLSSCRSLFLINSPLHFLRGVQGVAQGPYAALRILLFGPRLQFKSGLQAQEVDGDFSTLEATQSQSFSTLLPSWVTGKLVPISSSLWAGGGVHPGQVARPSQGSNTKYSSLFVSAFI